jgi:hypothetical protein
MPRSVVVTAMETSCRTTLLMATMVKKKQPRQSPNAKRKRNQRSNNASLEQRKFQRHHCSNPSKTVLKNRVNLLNHLNLDQAHATILYPTTYLHRDQSPYSHKLIRLLVRRPSQGLSPFSLRCHLRDPWLSRR